MFWCLQGASFGFFHDLIVTDNSYVVMENPIRMDYVKLLTKYMFAKACLAECLVFDPAKPVKIHLIDRPGKKKAAGGYGCR